MSGHGFSNAFQISDLSKNATTMATLQATLARHAMNRENERKGPDPHALRRDLTRVHPSKLPNVFSRNVFEEKPRLVNSLAVELE